MENNIPFVVSGGLAARVYGSPRTLHDIDIEIPDAFLEELAGKLRAYVVYGPKRYKDEGFDLMLMTMNHREQLIDLSGADSCRIFDKAKEQWVALPVALPGAPTHEIFGMKVPVIRKEDLIAYKNALSRNVDIEDIKFINV